MVLEVQDFFDVFITTETTIFLQTIAGYEYYYTICFGGDYIVYTIYKTKESLSKGNCMVYLSSDMKIAFTNNLKTVGAKRIVRLNNNRIFIQVLQENGFFEPSTAITNEFKGTNIQL